MRADFPLKSEARGDSGTRVQYAAHQRAQHEVERVGAEAAAKPADAIFGVVAPSVASADRLGIAPPAEAGRQRPAGEAALRAVELELLPAGLSPPLHDHRERFGRAVHRMQ